MCVSYSAVLSGIIFLIADMKCLFLEKKSDVYILFIRCVHVVDKKQREKLRKN
jgi:hypothetical protein